MLIALNVTYLILGVCLPNYIAKFSRKTILKYIETMIHLWMNNYGISKPLSDTTNRRDLKSQSSRVKSQNCEFVNVLSKRNP